ncbi:hypothetical protein [Thermococcus sp.]|uniref:hypothetical protein n=1 Tax=Thermococcus sp. TaxID=35749 RepID=UPI00262EAA9C|nr:hypothetical protein [Thermococcus sp.]
MDVVRVLYRELHYRRLKNNPQIAADPGKFKEQLRKTGDVKRGIAFQSVIFLLFGLMMGVAVWGAGNEGKAAVLLATYSLLPFFMALYTTAVNASYAVSMGIFEPLKPLPLRTGAKYLSVLLSLDNVPAIVAMLPPVSAMASYSLLAVVLGLFWVFIGAFLGHVLGLVLFTLFGSTSVGGRFSKLRTLVRVLGVLLFISIFYALNYVQKYVIEHYEQLLPFFSRYSLAYPFSVASIVEPFSSVALIVAYTALLVPLYLILLGRVWELIATGPPTSSSWRVAFRARVHHPVVALFLKDLKIIARKSALLVGLLFPLFLVLPTALSTLSGGITPRKVEFTLVMVAWVASIGVDAVLKTDGGDFSALLALPVVLEEFLWAKLLVMCLVPVLTSVGVVLLAAFRSPGFLRFIPAALVLPMLTSSVSLSFFYHGERGLSIPDTDSAEVLLLMMLNGFAIGTLALVWYLEGYLPTLVLMVTALAIVLWFLSR